MKPNLVITADVDGKKATLKLTEKEVESAISACAINGTTEIIIMKKYNGGACFYNNARHANAAQSRHKFEYAFTVKSTDLEKHLKAEPKKSEVKAPEVKKPELVKKD